LSKPFETKLNILVGRLLSSELGLKAISESISSHRRPDVIVYVNGVKIVLEGSYSKLDAERDVERRLEEGFAELGIALHYREEFSPNLTDSELEDRLRSSTFGVRLILSKDVSETLLPYLIGKRISTEWVSGWMDAKLADLLPILNETLQFLLNEKDVEQVSEKIEEKINEFVLSVNSVDADKEIAKKLYDILYKLYGLSVGDYRKIDELIYAQSALAILLSEAFYQSISAGVGLKSLESLTRAYGYRLGIRKAFEEILKVDYKPIYNTALQIIESIPDSLSTSLKGLTEIAEEISSKRALLRRDFTGKIYHKIVGDWSVRKGFATYFTTVPAAYLLAYLATFTRTGVFKNLEKFKNLEEFKDKGIKVGDFACGSGTLLAASYSALKDLYVYSMFGEGEEIDFSKFHKVLLEESIWGLDALKYAVQIASLNLAFQNPTVKVETMRTFSVPVGIVVNESRSPEVLLGSLKFLEGRAFPKIYASFAEQSYSFMEGVESGAIVDTQKVPSEIPEFDLIIMNPPFTRATGRGGREGGGLFGFILDENARQLILNKYGVEREKVRRMLENLTLRHLSLTKLNEFGIGTELYNIGQAGEGLLFLYLASKLVKEDGKIAFVLPKSLLTGISWTAAKSLLLEQFCVEHIVLSYDSKNGYNFSESTSLSETLIVARKRRKNEDKNNEQTIITILLKKPTTSLEARALALKIVGGSEGYLEVNGSKAYVSKVSREKLIERLSNWGSIAAFPDPKLTHVTDEILSGRLFEANIPVTMLGKVATIGIDAHQFHDAFKIVEGKPLDSCPIVYGGGEEMRLRMLIEPNARAVPKEMETKKGKVRRMGEQLFKDFSSILLVPDRIWVDTAHIIAMCCTEHVLSNIFYAVKLKSGENVGNRSKALCLWLNTTWGVLSILTNRSETRGRWIRLKMTHWKLQPVLDVTKLEGHVIDRLASVFDKYANADMFRLTEQFNLNKIDPVRFNMDKDFLEALSIKFDEEKIRELYKIIYENLIVWIGE